MFGGFFGGGGSPSNDKNNNSSTSSDTLSDTSASAPSPFGSSADSTSSLSLGSLSSGSANDTKTRLQQAIIQQSNLINAKYLIQKINDNCFEHCVAEPGSSLSGRERTCLSTCMEKYIDGWNVVSRTYVARGRDGCVKAGTSDPRTLGGEKHGVEHDESCSI